MEKFMTVEDAANMLTVPKKWVLAQIAAGRLACYRIGPQTIRISEEQLVEFTKRSYVAASSIGDMDAQE